ncbi:PepSY domain-containing protein [Micromonospora sp. NPDC005203]|uniref:PepSY domain-containing protein n=1 Tax=Micromonospora sp. NPDC005203 TaxID=3364226 RepID=UPI0036B0A763
MKRTNLLLATVGGSAVLAVAGVALGVNAVGDTRAGGTALAAATVAPTATDAPEAGATTAAPGTSGTPSAGASSGTPSGTPPTGTAPAGSAVDEKRAGEIALAKAGGGQIVEVESEQENGRPVWSVEIVAGETEHEVDIDRDNGSVVKAEQEPVDNDADDNDADDNDADDADDDDDDNDNDDD